MGFLDRESSGSKKSSCGRTKKRCLCPVGDDVIAFKDTQFNSMSCMDFTEYVEDGVVIVLAEENGIVMSVTSKQCFTLILLNHNLRLC